jgi:hypothetical protein
MLLCKLDIEGGETDVLPSVLDYLPRKTVCFLETHYPDEVCQGLLDPYRNAGFRVVETRRRPNLDRSMHFVEWCLTRLA